MLLFNRYQIGNLKGYFNTLSSSMKSSIDLWLSMAQGNAYWNEKAPPCGIIPSLIGAIADPISEEITIASENEKLLKAMQKVDNKIIEIVQNMITCGGCLLRPIYSNGIMSFEIIKLGNYIPTKYELDGSLSGAIIIKKITENKDKFILLEKHNFKNKVHIVEMELYKIIGENLVKTSLTSCEQTQNLTSLYQWENIEQPFIVEFRNPRANEIDGSNVPCALYQGHENLIKDADEQYARINWEQLAGKTRVFIDEDLLPHKIKENGKKSRFLNIADELKEVFVNLEGNGIGEEKINIFSPQLRTTQQIEAYQQILKEIENALRIGKGTLSNLETQPQTATAYKGGKQVLYNTVNTFESEIETKYKQLAYIFAYMLSAYEQIPFNDEITITYDESDRKDSALQRMEDLQEVQNGIMSKAEYRVKHYGETLEEAMQNVPQTDSQGSGFGSFFSE